MRVVFLDFDGPLIPLMSHEHKRGPLEKAWPSCVSAINRVTDTTGAKIVISSSWRWANDGSDATQFLKLWGVTGEVIGITPKLEEPWKPGSKTWIGVPRGREIKAWLDLHPEATEFVIIDDDDDMEGLSHRLIRTPFEVGFTESDAETAIAMLSKSPSS